MPSRPLIAALCLLLADTAFADDFLRGYAQAVLDLEAGGDSIKVIEADTVGRVVLEPERCLGDARREDIETLLRGNEMVSDVEWQMKGCEPFRFAEAITPRLPVAVLPAGQLFRPLIADPRQPQTALHYQFSDSPVQDFNAGAVSFGEYLSFFERPIGPGRGGIGLEAGVFSLFNLDASSNDLVNTDFLIGLPLTYRDSPWSYLFGLYHQSSHLGDEFLLGNPSLDRVNVSYEYWRGMASYDFDRWRVYGGGQYIWESDPEVDPWVLQIGAEYRRPRVLFDSLDFLAGLDVQSVEELDWEADISLLFGLARRRDERELRLMLEYFDGFSPNGQFFERRLKYFGIGLFYDF